MPDSIAPLLPIVAYEPNADVALDELNRAALALTGSRNAMIARLNDELGCLELSHGAGSEWKKTGSRRVQVDVTTRESIVGYVAATGKIFRSGDVQSEPRYRQLFDSTRSEIAIPVRDRYGRIRAVLNVESDKEDFYDDYREAVCSEIAYLIAIVLDRQEAQTRERALLEISNALDHAWTEQELIDGVIGVASDVLRFQAFSLFLLDSATDDFVLRGSVGSLRDTVGQIRYSRGQGCTGWVAETGKPVLLENPRTDPRWRGRHVEFPSEQIASFLAVPVIWRGSTIGVIRAIRRVTENQFLDNRFTESDQSVLMAIADHLATVLQSIRSVQKMVHTERMVAWGELSAKSSHMIGNRVFAMRGDVNELGYLLSQDPLNLGELVDVHKHLVVGVSRIEEILQEFRDFLTATQLTKERTRINSFLRDTVTEVFPKRAGVKLVLEFDGDEFEVDADQSRLRRAISELVENALHHVESGQVQIRTCAGVPADAPQGAIRAKLQYVTIEVEDTGPGVNPSQRELIFQPFFSSRIKGMGLGLSIVKGIVEAHGGSIYEGGKMGEGAKFVILLPLTERSISGTQ